MVEKMYVLYMLEMPINRGIEGSSVGMYRVFENYQCRKNVCSEKGQCQSSKRMSLCYQISGQK